jgi:hypothetical protein
MIKELNFEGFLTGGFWVQLLYANHDTLEPFVGEYFYVIGKTKSGDYVVNIKGKDKILPMFGCEIVPEEQVINSRFRII